jgi:hypothetical protein
VLLPDGSVWYPGSKRKLPAPTFLRVTVWALAFLVAIGGAGLIIEHCHPSWMDPIRHVVGPPGVLAANGGGPVPTTSSVPGGHSSNKMQETGHGFNSVTYSVPGAPYVLTIKTTQRCYIRVDSLQSGASLLNDTLGAGVTQAIVVPGGPATIQAYAAGASVSVSVQGTPVGNIAKLYYAVTYKFNPPSS